MNKETSTGKPQTPSALVISRHLVLVAIVACVNPYWTLSVESWATKAVGIFLITFFCSAVLAGFALLFFTRGIGKNWVGNFVRSLWVIAAFVLFGQWGS